MGEYGAGETLQSMATEKETNHRSEKATVGLKTPLQSQFFYRGVQVKNR